MAYGDVGALVLDPQTQLSADADQKKREVRSKLYHEAPNERMEKTPLVKMLLGEKGNTVENSKIEWGMKRHNAHYSIITGVYDSAALTSAIGASAATAKNTLVYVKMAEADAKQWLPGEEREHMRQDTYAVCPVDVVSLSLAGANSYAVCRTLAADTGNVLGNTGGSNVYANMVSIAMAEGSGLPDGFYEEPTMAENNTQIFMQALGLTGSELSDKSIFGETRYQLEQADCLERFNQALENAFWTGTRVSVTDAAGLSQGNTAMYTQGSLRVGRRLRMGGLKHALSTYAPTNLIVIPNITTFEGYDFTGKKWTEAGYDFLTLLAHKLSLTGGATKRVFCGSVAHEAIMNLFQSMAFVTIGNTFKDQWGFEVTGIKTFGTTLELHRHSGWSTNPSHTKRVGVIEPSLLHFHPKTGRDVTFIPSKDILAKASANGLTWVDGLKEGWFAEATMSWDNLNAMALIEGVGDDFHA